MKRLTGDWMEFNGVRMETRYTRLLEMPSRTLTAVRGQQITVPGRDGFIWQPEQKNGQAVRESLSVAVSLETKDGFDMDSIAVWLSGRGLLRFADEPNRAYEAYVIEGGDRAAKHPAFDAQVVNVTFACQPYRYIYPAPADIVRTTADTITNPGTAYSEPRIKVEGSGDIVLTIGAQMIEITGGGVIIDSALMDCLSTDGATLANGRVTLDEFPLLAPGANAVSWKGNVTRVTITPRSRSI